MRYPDLPLLFNLKDKELKELYNTVESWGAALTNELNTRDALVDNKPSTNIYAVVTITQISRPQKGDIAYAASAGKFKGYVSTTATQAWANLN